MSEFENLIWQCSFCRRTRPESELGQATRVRKVGPNKMTVLETRRYCPDSQQCRWDAGAWSVAGKGADVAPSNSVR